MMKLYIVVLLLLVNETLIAQKFKSEESIVTFYSEAAIENIAATNEKSSSLFDASTGAIVFLITISDFQFEKSLMQEHFNEKYMESEKYPKATFKGNIQGFDINAAGDQLVNAKGTLTIHGQSKEIDVKGTLDKQKDVITMKSSFIVELADYKIKIPKLLWQNIAENVEVKIEFTYKAL